MGATPHGQRLFCVTKSHSYLAEESARDCLVATPLPRIERDHFHRRGIRRRECFNHQVLDRRLSRTPVSSQRHDQAINPSVAIEDSAKGGPKRACVQEMYGCTVNCKLRVESTFQPAPTV